MNAKRVIGICIVMVLAISAGFIGVAAANDHKPDNEKKVSICHRNNNTKQPYGPKRIDVAESAADGGADRGDHFSEHKGPLASSEEVAEDLKDAKQDWGDIIPPIEGKHDGLNWTAEGQAMWENDCQFVEENGNGDGNGGENGNGEEENGEQGQVLGTTADQAPQVAAPVGGVEAGAGGAAGSAMVPLAGLGSSLSALGYGVYRLRRK